MILIWKGEGWLIPIIALLGFGFSAAVGFSITDTVGGGPRIAFAFASLGAAASTLVLSRRVGRDPGREVLDPETGEVTVLRKKHSLYFIPMHAWPYLIAATAVLPFVLG